MIAGASLGFLRHNFPPASIFLGDAGSLMLGFLLAALAVKLDLVGASGVVRSAVAAMVLGRADLRHGTRRPCLSARPPSRTWEAQITPRTAWHSEV